MKLPEIHGINKIRDAKIVQMYVRDHMGSDEIADKVDVCASRVRQILYRNRSYLKTDKEWEQTKQVNRVNRLIAKRKGESKKDAADLEKILSDIIHAGKPVIDQSTHINKKTFVYLDSKAMEEDGSNRIKAELPSEQV